MVKLKDLHKAHYIAAKLIEKFGSEYLIFFERMDRELKEAKKKEDMIEAALSVAKAQE